MTEAPKQTIYWFDPELLSDINSEEVEENEEVVLPEGEWAVIAGTEVQIVNLGAPPEAEEIFAFAMNANAEYDPTPDGFPVTVNRVGPNSESGMDYDAARGWGWVGSQDAVLDDRTNNDDPRLQERWSNSSFTRFRVDLEPGDYDVYLAAGAHTTTTPGLRITDRDDDTIISTVLTIDSEETGNGEVVDADNNVRSGAAWVSESIIGGTPARITVTGDSVWVDRSDTGYTPHLQFIAFERVDE